MRLAAARFSGVEAMISKIAKYPVEAELGRGEGVVVIPYPKGRVVRKIAFAMVEDLPTMNFPIRDLPNIDLVYESTYRGTEVVNVKSLASGETTQSQSLTQGEKKAS